MDTKITKEEIEETTKKLQDKIIELTNGEK